MISFFLNNKLIETMQPAGISLLDFIRNSAQLKGTKSVCMEGDCGACTVLLGKIEAGHIIYQSVASCIMPLGNVQGKHIVTVEGISDKNLNPVQQILVDVGASQCGFCTPGVVMALTGFLLNSKSLTEEDARMWVEGNICRCTGYAGISRAAKKVAEFYAPRLNSEKNRINSLIKEKIVPNWFADVPSWLERLSMDNKSDAHLSRSLPVAGATDLYVQQQEALQDMPLRFLSQEDIRSDIWVDGDLLYIGGRTSAETLRNSEALNQIFPTLKKSMRLVSSLLIRQQATVAGNLVNASPIGDMAIILLSMDAVLGLADTNKIRTVRLDDFFKGYKKIDLKDGEVIKWIRIPSKFSDTMFNFEKVSRRNHLDIASVNSACRISIQENMIKEAVITAGGIAPVPFLLQKASHRLTGKKLNVESIKGAVQCAYQEIKPISDVRGTEKYKRLLLRQLIYAHFITLFPEYAFERELA